MISSYSFHLLLGVGLCVSIYSAWGFPGSSVVKNLPANAGAMDSVPGLGRFPGKGNGYHSSILAWKIPWTEDPCRLQFMGSQRVGHDWATETNYLFYV